MISKTDLGVLRLKIDDPENPHCYKQELALVARTLTQQLIVLSKNSKILIKIKAVSLFFFFYFEKKTKKKTVKVILNIFHLPWPICHVISK